jgi:nucleotidyltransferase substrate binding protein (TIGR01987 family)
MAPWGYAVKVPLDLSTARFALESLRRAIARSLGDPSDEEVRDSVIQRFEYTYELAWKGLQRYLTDEGVEDIAMFSKRDLFREAARRGIIADPGVWFGYQAARNETSHTYNAYRAMQVHAQAVAFAQDADRLLTELERRLHA